MRDKNTFTFLYGKRMPLNKNSFEGQQDREDRFETLNIPKMDDSHGVVKKFLFSKNSWPMIKILFSVQIYF